MSDLEKPPPPSYHLQATEESTDLISNDEHHNDEVQEPVSKWELRGWYGFGFAVIPPLSSTANLELRVD